MRTFAPTSLSRLKEYLDFFLAPPLHGQGKETDKREPNDSPHHNKDSNLNVLVRRLNVEIIDCFNVCLAPVNVGDFPPVTGLFKQHHLFED